MCLMEHVCLWHIQGLPAAAAIDVAAIALPLDLRCSTESSSLDLQSSLAGSLMRPPLGTILDLIETPRQMQQPIDVHTLLDPTDGSAFALAAVCEIDGAAGIAAASADAFAAAIAGAEIGVDASES